MSVTQRLQYSVLCGNVEILILVLGAGVSTLRLGSYVTEMSLQQNGQALVMERAGGFPCV